MSRMKLLVPVPPTVPVELVAIALTAMVPSPKVIKSAAVNTTAAAAPVPVTVLVTVFVPLAKVTAMLEPASEVTVTTPVDAVASALVAPPDTPLPKAITGALTGAVEFRVKLVLPALLELPAASVEIALTEMVPLPNVLTSADANVTAAAAPVPVTVLVTVLVPFVKVTTTVEPTSALTVTTPPAEVAVASVAPPETPVPKTKVGAVGATVSRMKLLEPAALALPAASVAMALTAMVPSPKVARSAAASVTAAAAPVPVTVLVTVLVPLVNVTATVEPTSALTVTAPLDAVASALVAPPNTPVPKARTGALGANVSPVNVTELLAMLFTPPTVNIAAAMLIEPVIPLVDAVGVKVAV